MNVPIDAGAGLIFLVSAAVGYAVHRHTRATSATTPPTGDIGVAFTAASITLLALAFLFGIPNPPAQEDTAPSPTHSQPAMPPSPTPSAAANTPPSDQPAPQTARP